MAENRFDAKSDIYVDQFDHMIDQQTVESMSEYQKKIDKDGINVYYKCYIGKGNNQMMVRAIFKNRFWWLFHEKDEPEKVNFFWTQLRKVSIMNSLICKFVNLKDKN